MLFIAGNFCADEPQSPPAASNTNTHAQTHTIAGAAGMPRAEAHNISSHNLHFRSLHPAAMATCHLPQSVQQSDGDACMNLCVEVLFSCLHLYNFEQCVAW
jgi:hypothetical protein